MFLIWWGCKFYDIYTSLLTFLHRHHSLSDIHFATPLALDLFEDQTILVFYYLVGVISQGQSSNASPWRQGYKTLEYCCGVEKWDPQKCYLSHVYKPLPMEALHPFFHISSSQWNCLLHVEQQVPRVVEPTRFPSFWLAIDFNFIFYMAQVNYWITRISHLKLHYKEF